MGKNSGADSTMHDVYRAACIKESELVLEQSGKLLRKWLASFFASNSMADKIAFKDLFRWAAKCDLLANESVERWLFYRDLRNSTAHDCGERLAEDSLNQLSQFIADARALADALDRELE